MRFIIKHEMKGRMRIHLLQNRMTYEQADILLYFLTNMKTVSSAKVYERTQDFFHRMLAREMLKSLLKHPELMGHGFSIQSAAGDCSNPTDRQA